MFKRLPCPIPTLRGSEYLLDRSAKLSHKGVLKALLENGKPPKEWARARRESKGGKMK